MKIFDIEQNWDIKKYLDNPTYPFIVIDNWYTPNEEKAVWKELDFLHTRPKENIERAENTIVAKDPNGVSLSNAYRFYIENYYQDRILSPIFNCMYKQKSKEFNNILSDLLPYYRSFECSNSDNSLISYYEDTDYYDFHYDAFAWTCLIWMVKEPRIFEGGDFILKDPDVEIKLKNNRMIMFPCCYLHKSTPIKFHTTPNENGYGKYTITHFYTSYPNG